MEKTLKELVAQGAATHSEIQSHITSTIDRGLNSFELRDKTVITSDGSNWDWIPEDGYYQLSQNHYRVY